MNVAYRLNVFDSIISPSSLNEPVFSFLTIKVIIDNNLVLVLYTVLPIFTVLLW